MTRDQAEQVRAWRMSGSLSLRNIAELWVDAYGETELYDEFLPGLSGNQLVGVALCERASVILREFID